jgi:hypothetical protein
MLKVASTLLVSGLGAMSYQAWHLITEGVWKSVTLRSALEVLGLDHAQVQLDGLQFLLEPLLDQSPAALAAALGFGMLIAAWISERRAHTAETSHLNTLRSEAQARQLREIEAHREMQLRKRIHRITHRAA